MNYIVKFIFLPNRIILFNNEKDSNGYLIYFDSVLKKTERARFKSIPVMISDFRSKGFENSSCIYKLSNIWKND